MSWKIENLFNDLLLNPEVIPHEQHRLDLYRWLRANHPHVLVTDPEDKFDPFRAISRYQDVLEIEKRPDIFSNYPYLALGTREERQTLLKRIGRPVSFPTLLNMDRPQHSAYRKLTQTWFNPGSINNLAKHVRVVAQEHVDKIAARGRCDFAQDITTWYPLHIIQMILGIPREDEQLMMMLTQQFMSPLDPDTRGEQVEIDPEVAINAMGEYFTKIIEDRKKSPKDDLSTIIANAEIDGVEMPLYDKIGYLILIIVAGHDTTKFASSGGMLALLTHKQQMKKLRENRELMPKAVEEMIRWASPVRYFLRLALQDYQLGETLIKKGEYLMLLYTSASHDTNAIEDGDKFIIDREPNRHLSFGHGIHKCLGQHLARLEMKILFEEMLNRFETIELDGDPEGLQSSFVSGIKKLPIRMS